MSFHSETLGNLRRHPIFSGAKEATLERLAQEATQDLFDVDDVVVRAGDPQTAVLVVFEGVLHLYKVNGTDDAQLLVGTLEPPSIFGDAELYSGKPWVVSARAAQPTAVLAIKNRTFQEVVLSDGAVAARLYRDACARHMLAIEIMQVVGLQSTQNQIMRVIGDLAQRRKSEEVSISRTEIARSIGSNPRTISRHLKELEDGQFLRFVARDRVRILKPEAFSWRGLEGGLGAHWRLPQ